MRTFIRTVISIVAGFILMWPLGYIDGALNWPTFENHAGHLNDEYDHRQNLRVNY